MALLFRPKACEDEREDTDSPENLVDGQPSPELPGFAVIVSAAANNGWHVAAVLGESSNPDFYVRAVTVRWPFLIARPVRSNRTSDTPADPDRLSPTGTTPARKLVVNWDWLTVEGSVSQLRFLVQRNGFPGLRATRPVTVRLTLKQSAWPRRRIVVKMQSNPIDWTARGSDLETPETPPEQST